MKRAAFFLFDSFTAGILFLLFTTFLFIMIPTFEQSPSASTELVHFQQALIHSGMIDQFVNTGSPTQLQSYVDVSLPSYLCVNISYYDDTNVYQDSLLKTGCDSQNLKTVLYGTFYSDDIYILKLEGWYE